jgi:hypothetical protein
MLTIQGGQSVLATASRYAHLIDPSSRREIVAGRRVTVLPGVTR